MDTRNSSAHTTLTILLGASQWPAFPDFHGSQAFAQVAAAFSQYILDPQQFGLPSENFLNLFDTEIGPDKIDQAIRYFLDRRTAELKQAGHGPTDLLFYFVGHGGFVGRNSEYYLAVRCTSSANPAVSGIRMEPLATTLTERARYLRRLIILDCCYAAAAFTAFQAEGPAQVAIQQTVDLFKEQAKRVGKGTALLCSSGKKIPSLLTVAEDSTLFSRALLHVLVTSGNPYRPDEAYLSLREVADLTEEVLGTLLDEQAPRPELHSPDQVDGDVAEVPFFPNPVVKVVQASPSSAVWSRQEEVARYATALPPNQSPRHESVLVVPGKPKPVSPVVSRRTVVVGLAGLAVAGSGVWLATHYEQYLSLVSGHAPTSIPHRAPTPSPSLSPTPNPIPMGKLLYTYRGHSNTQYGHVFAVAWSPDGKRIASGSGDDTVQVWDAADGGHVFTYRGFSAYSRSVAWSPNGKRIAAVNDVTTVQVWDAVDGGNVFTYHGHSAVVNSVAWSPDGKHIASASNDETVQVWDAANGSNIFSFGGHKAAVNVAVWSPDSKRIASASLDVQVWDATDGGNVLTYRGHSIGPTAVAWSPDGKRIASGGYDHTVQVWNATDGGNVYTYGGHADIWWAVAWSPDSRRIASASGVDHIFGTASADHTVQVWDAADGGNVFTYDRHSDTVYAVAWSPDGKSIASGSYDKTVQVWVAG